MEETINLRAIRRQSGKTAKEAAAYMGITPRALYQWESGQHDMLSRKLSRLLEFYGYDAPISKIPDILPEHASRDAAPIGSE